GTATASGAGRTGGQSFATVLAGESAGIQFSRHAMRRIEQRGLQIDQAQMERLQQAVGRAEAKGAKDSLILLDELALVVSIQNHTVVTAMDEGSQKEHVFTNIDSVVIAH
ncbi:MAG: TIGR02530 family flagellar biosynthesis protein, partial [Dehalococcoidia bacterium]